MGHINTLDGDEDEIEEPKPKEKAVGGMRPFVPGGGRFKVDILPTNDAGYLRRVFVNRGKKTGELVYQIIQFFKYIHFKAKSDPLYDNITGQCGGYYRPHEVGPHRRKIGASRGFPLVAVFIASSGFPAYFVEVRCKGHRIQSKDTIKWFDRLTKQGFKVDWFYSWQEAVRSVEKYLGRVADEDLMAEIQEIPISAKLAKGRVFASTSSESQATEVKSVPEVHPHPVEGGS